MCPDTSRCWNTYRDISRLRALTPWCSVAKTGRNSNRAAHSLAKLTSRPGISKVWLAPVPQMVLTMYNQNIVNNDVINIWALLLKKNKRLKVFYILHLERFFYVQPFEKYLWLMSSFHFDIDVRKHTFMSVSMNSSIFNFTHESPNIFLNQYTNITTTFLSLE
jgi:hypothetical protein